MVSQFSLAYQILLYINHIIEQLSIEYCKTKANYLPIRPLSQSQTKVKPKQKLLPDYFRQSIEILSKVRESMDLSQDIKSCPVDFSWLL